MIITGHYPIPVGVEETEHHRSRSIGQRNHMVKIVSIADKWQIDEEWWRGKSISRTYYQVVTQDEQWATIFRDLVVGGWYRQNA